MSFVLDNSVTMRWCFGDGSTADRSYAAKVALALVTDTACVPAIWALEVANVLTRAHAQGALPSERRDSFLRLLEAMRIEADPATAEHALTDTLRAADLHRLTAYDAAYLELAKREALPLATLDADLRRAAKRAGVAIF